ncbi:hypothetical protein MRX96_031129 [Rhipicephalus microplus]
MTVIQIPVKMRHSAVMAIVPSVIALGLYALAGFPEFYKPERIRAIRSWQRGDGCFNDSLEIVGDPLTTFKRKPARTKRAEIRLEDRCGPHKTILGAIAM